MAVMRRSIVLSLPSQLVFPGQNKVLLARDQTWDLSKVDFHFTTELHLLPEQKFQDSNYKRGKACESQQKLFLQVMDPQLAVLNLDLVFHIRSGRLHAAHLLCCYYKTDYLRVENHAHSTFKFHPLTFNVPCLRNNFLTR